MKMNFNSIHNVHILISSNRTGRQVLVMQEGYQWLPKDTPNTFRY